MYAIQEHVGITKAMAAKNGYELDTNQEENSLPVVSVIDAENSLCLHCCNKRMNLLSEDLLASTIFVLNKHDLELLEHHKIHIHSESENFQKDDSPTAIQPEKERNQEEHGLCQFFYLPVNEMKKDDGGTHLPHVAEMRGHSDYGAVELSQGYEDDEDHRSCCNIQGFMWDEE
ncbi:hypothetical protein Tco_1060633 [Tanacetum coccineum]